MSLQAEEHGNKSTTPVTPGGENIHPAHPCSLQFELEGSLDLSKLGVDELFSTGALAVVLFEDVMSFLASVLGDQPSRALREETGFGSDKLAEGRKDRRIQFSGRTRGSHAQNEGDLEERGTDLQPRGDAPRKVVRDGVGAEGDTGSHDLKCRKVNESAVALMAPIRHKA